MKRTHLKMCSTHSDIRVHRSFAILFAPIFSLCVREGVNLFDDLYYIFLSQEKNKLALRDSFGDHNGGSDMNKEHSQPPNSIGKSGYQSGLKINERDGLLTTNHQEPTLLIVICMFWLRATLDSKTLHVSDSEPMKTLGQVRVHLGSCTHMLNKSNTLAKRGRRLRFTPQPGLFRPLHLAVRRQPINNLAVVLSLLVFPPCTKETCNFIFAMQSLWGKPKLSWRISFGNITTKRMKRMLF